MHKYRTRAEKIDMFTMRLDGYSYTDIAKKYYTTRQNIQTILSNALSGDHFFKSVRYPALRYYLNQEEVSFDGLYDMMKAEDYAFTKPVFRKRLKDGTLNNYELEVLSHATGLSLEELNYMD